MNDGYLDPARQAALTASDLGAQQTYMKELRHRLVPIYRRVWPWQAARMGRRGEIGYTIGTDTLDFIRPRVVRWIERDGGSSGITFIPQGWKLAHWLFPINDSDRVIG